MGLIFSHTHLLRIQRTKAHRSEPYADFLFHFALYVDQFITQIWLISFFASASSHEAKSACQFSKLGHVLNLRVQSYK